MSEYWKWIYDHARGKDQVESSLADVLDVKASIVLVAITFLATLSMSVFELPSLAVWLKVLQTGNIVLARISHHQHSARGAIDFSPGRQPWERSSLSSKPRQGRKKTIPTGCRISSSVAPSGALSLFLPLPSTSVMG